MALALLTQSSRAKKIKYMYITITYSSYIVLYPHIALILNALYIYQADLFNLAFAHLPGEHTLGDTL